LSLSVELDTGAATYDLDWEHGGTSDKPPWMKRERTESWLLNLLCPETVTIARWVDGVYRCAVRRLWPNAPLAGCGAEVCFDAGGGKIIMTCPQVGQGKWWHVFAYDARRGKLTIVNAISDQPLRDARDLHSG